MTQRITRRLPPALLGLLALSFWATPIEAQGYQLVWEDNFDGTSVDAANWSFETGDGCPSLCGWGNNELQYYRSQNTTVSGGFLTITAKEESFGGRAYTSSRLVTKNKADFTYGRMEMRARMPEGQGLWPAFWMLFTNTTYGGWAASGEIDIMEYLGHDTDRVLGTIHYGGPFPGNVFSGDDYILPSGDFNTSFHTFALEWEPDELRWYVDGTLYACQYDWYSTGGLYPAPFNHDFHFLLNLAVGGNLPGPPDASTSFPQEFVVDYVRVYEKPVFPGCRVIFTGMEETNLFGEGWFSFNGIAGGGISRNTANLPPERGCIASLNSGWGSGGNPGFFGGFGRKNPVNLTDLTHFTFWIDPDPGQDYTLVVQFQDDDNGDDDIPGSPDGIDDEFEAGIVVNASGGDVLAGGGWQKVSIPLAGLVDDNSFHYGGNGIFDPFPTGLGGNGQLVNVVVSVVSNSGADVTFRTDGWEFVREEGSVEGSVWLDLDGDGVREGGEPGISGATVSILDEFLNELDSEVTSPSGFYSFPDLPGGEYSVEIDTTGVMPGFPSGDPDGLATPNQAFIPVDCSGVLADQDFGYSPTPVAVPPGVIPGPTLSAAFPNPFTASTRIAFALNRPGPVRLTVYGLAGEKVRDLLVGSLASGPHAVDWDGRDGTGHEVASGFYLVVLRAEGVSEARRVLRIR